MAVLASYDPSSGGGSDAAQVDTIAGQNAYALGMDRGQYRTDQSRMASQFQQVDAPALMSSLGASGQFYGTAANKAIGNQQTMYNNQQADLTSAFNRAKMDMKRQEAYASVGLIL